MKVIVLALILFVIFPLSLTARIEKEKVEIKARPAWVKSVTSTVPENIEEKISSLSTGGSYNLLTDRQYNVAEQTYYGHFSSYILNEQGLQNLATVSVVFDPSFQSLEFHSVRVVRNGKEINKLSLDDIEVIQRESSSESYIYDGRKTALINLKDIRVGDILEYDFSIKGENPVFQGKFFSHFYWQFSVPVEKIFYRIVSAKERNLHFRENGKTPKVKISFRKGLKEYEWVKEKTTALDFESNTPSWYDPTPVTLVSEFSGWDEVVSLLLPHYQNRKEISDNDTKELYERLFTKNDTKETKVKKLLTFVQDEVRYLGLENGISAYKPHPPADVLNQKFGDCKDKSLLLCALLSDIGVTAYPALVNTQTRSSLGDYLPSPGMFDHCIVQAELNDTIIWYDPTMTSQGGLYNNTPFPAYGKSLVLRKGSGELTDVPVYDKDTRSITEYYNVKYNNEGKSLFAVTSRYEGFEASGQRSLFKSRNIEDLENDYLNYYATIYPDIEQKKPLKTRDNNKIFETEENYQVSGIWTETENKKDQLQAEFFPLYINDFLRNPDDKIRKMPLLLNYPLKIEEKLIIEMPSAWPVEEYEKNIENDFFRFTSTVNSENSVITLLYTYELLKDHVPAADVRIYLRDLTKARNELGYQVIYLDTEGNDPDLSIPLLIVALLAFTGFIIMAVKANKHVDLPGKADTEYYSISGWLFLPMLGLFLSPILIALNLFSWDYFDGNVIHTFFQKDSGFYNPVQGGLFVAEIIFNSGMIVFAVFLLTLMFSRRTSFPFFIKVYLIVNFLFQLLEIVIIHPLNLLSGPDLHNLYYAAFKALVSAAIWVPYFSISERVKHTFTVMLNPGRNFDSAEATYSENSGTEEINAENF